MYYPLPHATPSNFKPCMLLKYSYGDLHSREPFVTQEPILMSLI
jgi:hypothetical protein